MLKCFNVFTLAVGGLLNATCGNATELIIAILALANNKVASGSNLKLSFATKQGTFKGTALTETGQVAFQGVVMQKVNSGAGFFLRAGQSGKVELQSRP